MFFKIININIININNFWLEWLVEEGVEASAQILSYSWEAETKNLDTNGQAEGVHTYNF
jgi:hypothetical protein